MTATSTIQEPAPRSQWATTLGELCDRFGGGIQTGPFGSQLHASDYAEDGTPVVMPQDLHDGEIVCDRIARVPARVVAKLPRHALRFGDVVFSRRGDVTRFAVVTHEQEGWLCGTGCIRIRLNCPEVNIPFFRRYLQQGSVGSWLKHHAKGVTMPNLNTDIVRELPFVYPPLPEQRRIATILDKAESLRTKRRGSHSAIQALKHSIFANLFGDPLANSKSWSVQSLGELATYVSSGITPLGGSNVYQQSGVLFIRSQNVLMGRLELDDAAYVSPELHNEMKRTWVKNGDVLLNITGASIGRVHYFDGPDDTANVNQHVCIIRLERTRAIPEYISAALGYPTFNDRIVNQNSGATRQAFNFEQVRKFAIPVPPLQLQQEFACALQQLDALSAKAEVSTAAFDTLLASLQHRAFRGEL